MITSKGIAVAVIWIATAIPICITICITKSDGALLAFLISVWGTYLVCRKENADSEEVFLTNDPEGEEAKKEK